MMPLSTQALYFQLGMNADDDGFCEHFSIMRMVEAKPDDLRVLQAKDFVKVFDDKVLVVLDWKENNYLRSDRYTPSKYLEVYKEELKALGIPNGNQMATQVRLGKDRLDSAVAEPPAFTDVPIDQQERPERPTKAKYPHALEVFDWFPNRQKSWESMKNIQEREYAEYLFSRGKETVQKALRYVASQSDNPDFKYVVVKPSDLEKKWEDIKIYANRNR